MVTQNMVSVVEFSSTAYVPVAKAITIALMANVVQLRAHLNNRINFLALFGFIAIPRWMYTAQMESTNAMASQIINAWKAVSFAKTTIPSSEQSSL